MNFDYKPLSRPELMHFVQLGAKLPFNPPNTWVVNETEKIRLICLGGRGDSRDRVNYPPDHYLLIIKDDLYPFQAWQTEIVKDGRASYTFEIVSLIKPLGLDRSALEGMLRDALAAYWGGLTGRPVDSVSVVMPSNA